MSAGIVVDVNKGIVSPVFAGREAELALMAGAFEAAAAGTPGTVLLGAEAGGGKSRLAGSLPRALLEALAKLNVASWGEAAATARRLHLSDPP